MEPDIGIVMYLEAAKVMDRILGITKAVKKKKKS
jgi:hypothetical protein